MNRVANAQGAAKRARVSGAWVAAPSSAIWAAHGARPARELGGATTPYARARAAAAVAPLCTGAYDQALASRVEPFAGRACGNGALAAATHLVRGAVAAFRFPQGALQYDGAFAIVALRSSQREAGATLKITRPKKGERRAVASLDLYHYYVFACAYEKPDKKKGGTQGSYRVLETLAAHALPFDRPLLAAMLQRELSMPRKLAADTALTAPGPRGAALDVDALHGVAPWFDELFEHCDYFHDAHLSRLEATWPREALRLVARARLGELEHALQTRPLALCFSWLGGFGEALPELDEAQLRAAAPQRYGAGAAPQALLELAAVRFYALLKLGFHARGHMYATPYDAEHGAAVGAFLANQELVAFAEREHMLTVVAHHACPCVYAHGDLVALRQLRDDMCAVCAAPDTAERRKPPKRKPRRSKYDVELSDEQQAAVAQAVSNRIFAVMGGAGSGKTCVGRYIYKHFEEGEVLCLAFMGLTVSLLKKRVGAAMTIDKLVQRVNAAADRQAAQLAASKRRKRGRDQLEATVRAGDACVGMALGPLPAPCDAATSAVGGTLSISTDADGAAQRFDGAAEARALNAVEADGAKTLLRKLAPRVLLFDEMSQINVRRLAAVFAALRRNGGPPLERVFFLGDAAQCTSIDRGAFMPAYLERLCDKTPYAPLFCTRLLANHRVSAESQLILRNVERLARGAVAELELSRDAKSAHPFLVLRRPLTLEAAATLMAPFLVRDTPVELGADAGASNEADVAMNEAHDDDAANEVTSVAAERVLAEDEDDFGDGAEVAGAAAPRRVVAERRGGPARAPEPRTAQLLVQRDKERSAFNAIFAARDASAMAVLGRAGARDGHVCAGQRIMFRQNRDASLKREPPHLRSNGVKNGIIAYVTAVTDVCVDAGTPAVAVAHTGAPPTAFGGRDSRRMLHFVVEGDERRKARRISLHNYALAHIERVDAMTISKMQGCEADTIVIYLHADLSWTFTLSDLLVAITRARKRVVIVCSEAPRSDFHGRSELEQITRQHGDVRYEQLAYFLPEARELVSAYRSSALAAADRAALHATTGDDEEGIE